MEPHLYLQLLRQESGALAASASQGLDRAVPRYREWTVADLVRHTGRIHRWVTEIVRSRATERLPQPDAEVRDDGRRLLDWFIAGSEELAAVLTATDPATPVWTFAGDRTAGFWRRRMALETTVHRWDAQQAMGTPGPIGPDIALEGIEEALHVYMEPRLAGADVRGGGAVVTLRCGDSGRTWWLRLDDRSVAAGSGTGNGGPASGVPASGGAASPVDARPAMADTASPPLDAPRSAVIEGPAPQVWLFLMGRLPLHALHVHGDMPAAEVCSRAVRLLEPPRR